MKKDKSWCSCFSHCNQAPYSVTSINITQLSLSIKLTGYSVPFKKITNSFSYWNKSGWKLNTLFRLEPFFPTAFLFCLVVELKQQGHPISSSNPLNQLSPIGCFSFVAPASPCSHTNLHHHRSQIVSWYRGLDPQQVSPNLFGSNSMIWVGRFMLTSNSTDL